MTEQPYTDQEPTRDEVDALPGPTLIEFGTGWCGYCQAAQPLLAEALADRPDVRHLKIEDGKGRRLGRSFRVNLWPTFVVMVDGQEVGRVVRPHTASAIRKILAGTPRARTARGVDQTS